MLMIRFQRIGRTNDPAFRIAVLEKERAAKSNRIVEKLGSYNPRTKALILDAEAVKGWIAKGAQPTGTVKNLLISKGIIEGKKVNVLPKKTVPKKEEPVAEAAPAVKVAAETVVEAAPAETPVAEAAPAEAEAPAAEPAPEAVPEESKAEEVPAEVPAA